jgi:hypothetical protein
MDICRFELPSGIVIEMRDGAPSIESCLGEVLSSDNHEAEESLRVVGVIEGIEHLLMSLAKAGVDLTLPLYVTAVRDCIENLRPGPQEVLPTQTYAAVSRPALNITEQQECPFLPSPHRVSLSSLAPDFPQKAESPHSVRPTVSGRKTQSTRCATLTSSITGTLSMISTTPA